MEKPLRNPAPADMLAKLEAIAGVPITRPMRKGTAIKLLRLAEQEDDGSWEFKCVREDFWRQLAKYTDSNWLTLIAPSQIESARRIKDT